MKIQLVNRLRRQAGYSALFIVMVLVGASVLVLGATLNRAASGTRLNDRNVQYTAADGAAEAAVEKVLAQMMIDFANNGETTVINNTNYYQTSLLPTSSENPYWTNFVWSDGNGNSNRIYVTRITTNANAPYVQLEEQYAGLSGYASTYRILANVTPINTTFNYAFTNAVQQDVQLAQIPVFQFALFYNGLLEFSDTATLIVTGPVHANSNIYVGSPDNLVFNSMVTTTGNITSPANAGYATSSWTGTNFYLGSPSPGYLTGQPSLTLPIGTNSTSGTNVQQILYPPPAGELATSSMGQQRYYNKAGMIIMVYNTTFSVTLKSSVSDPFPVVFTNTLTWLSTNTYFPFLTTNTFTDWRETDNMAVTQIDVGKLNSWMQTNMYVYATNAPGTNKFSASVPLNILYVADWRATNSTTWLSAVRLTDGATIPTNGLTVATPCPLYIQGVYNCPNSAYLNSTNTTTSSPASVACDALTILSPAWVDSASTAKALNQTATSDTVNTAIITGVVTSTGTGSTQYSGGANNLPRLLENWSNKNTILTLNTSIVCLYSSTWATNQFQLPGVYYDAPWERQFSFDQNYTLSQKMPPGTPNICRLIRSSWCNPQPGVVNYSDVTLDFVPH